MKIVSVTMVKNESDIIESFIRYHINIVDEMIILDNGSTDSTPNIIENLINEGLSITIINDTDSSYAQNIKITKLLKLAVKRHSADIVCLLDCDEFLISNDGKNPRKILEAIDTSKYYFVKWTTYVPTPSDDYNIKFIPKRITHVRDEKFEKYYKVIVPKDIVLNYTIDVEMGSHDLIFKKDKAPNDYINLKLAHFPLRSKEQCMSKIIIGWPNVIAVNTENENWSAHWKKLFYKIKEDNDISLEDLELFSKQYPVIDSPDIPLINQPLNLDFCKNIEIKYDEEYNYLSNILEDYVSLANEALSLKKELNLLKGETTLFKSIKIKLYEKFIR